jgi:hypothetical protein
MNKIQIVILIGLVFTFGYLVYSLINMGEIFSKKDINTNVKVYSVLSFVISLIFFFIFLVFSIAYRGVSDKVQPYLKSINQILKLNLSL